MNFCYTVLVSGRREKEMPRLTIAGLPFPHWWPVGFYVILLESQYCDAEDDEESKEGADEEW